MPIKHWPVAERPREKLLQKGSAALSDAELLAIFLRTGVNGKTAVDLARDLIIKCRRKNILCHQGPGTGQICTNQCGYRVWQTVSGEYPATGRSPD